MKVFLILYNDGFCIESVRVVTQDDGTCKTAIRDFDENSNYSEKDIVNVKELKDLDNDL